jgi:PAS domain S-box-containing protein
MDETVETGVPLLDLYLDRFRGFVALLDDAGVCRFLSPSYETVTGRSASSALGRAALEDLGLVHPDERAPFRSALEESSAGSPALTVECRFLHSGGHYVWLECVLVALPDNPPQAGGIVILARDVSTEKDAERQMALLAERAIREDEEARREVAADLHDVVAGDLLAARAALDMLLASGLEAPGAPGVLRSISETVGGALKKVRSLSSGLRPEALEFAGLAEALRDQVERFKDKTGMEARFECDCEATGLAADDELAVFRIAQESLMNAYRHSGAENVEVSLRRPKGSLRLTVSDDGRGFDPGAAADPLRPPDHLGILGMRERARIVAGVLDIESSPGEGTTVSLRIPQR